MRIIFYIGCLALALITSSVASAGWPLAPTDQPHGVYGTFLNPGVAYEPGWALYRKKVRRLESGDFVGYHLGIDLPVNDSLPYPAAPAGTSWPVFSVESGQVTQSDSPDGQPLPSEGCLISNGTWPWRTVIGRFIYGHIRPTVEVGQEVAEGDLIGWTCLGAWHVHLGEREGPGWDGRYINPLRPGGPLSAEDTANPRVVAYRFSESRLSIEGSFSASVLVGDRWPYKDWSEAPEADLHPWHLRFVLIRGTRILSKEDIFAFTSPRVMREHYNLSLTMRTMPVRYCAEGRYPDTSCQPALWVRAWSGQLPSAEYKLKTIAWDGSGNRAERSITFEVN